MIMIIFSIIIHAVSAKGQVVDESVLPSAAPLILPRVRLPAFFQRGGEFAGVNSIQQDTFSGRLNILWSDCNE